MKFQIAILLLAVVAGESLSFPPLHPYNFLLQTACSSYDLTRPLSAFRFRFPFLSVMVNKWPAEDQVALVNGVNSVLAGSGLPQIDFSTNAPPSPQQQGPQQQRPQQLQQQALTPAQQQWLQQQQQLLLLQQQQQLQQMQAQAGQQQLPWPQLQVNAGRR